MRIIDVSDPTSPTEVGGYEIPGTSMDVYVRGTNVFIADDWKGLKIVDVSNPMGLDYFDTPGFSRRVYIMDNYAYIANGPVV